MTTEADLIITEATPAQGGGGTEWTGAVLRGLESGKRMQIHALQTVGPALTAVSVAYDTYHLGAAVTEDVQHYQKVHQEVVKLEKIVDKIDDRLKRDDLDVEQRKKAEDALKRYRNELQLLKKGVTKV